MFMLKDWENTPNNYQYYQQGYAFNEVVDVETFLIQYNILLNKYFTSTLGIQTNTTQCISSTFYTGTAILVFLYCVIFVVCITKHAHSLPNELFTSGIIIKLLGI